MPIRRFNYTGRQRINHEDVYVTIDSSSVGPAKFEAVLNLDNYELPEDAVIYLEAYRLTSWMRFPYGTVGKIVEPGDRWLFEFSNPESVLFRIRVVKGVDGQGLMIAKASGIRPKLSDEEPSDRIPLLSVVPSDDLKKEVFRVDYAEGDRPILLINDMIEDWKSAARSPAFTSLVLPSVMRQILTRFLIQDENYNEEDETTWSNRWVRFAESLDGVSTYQTDEEDRQQIEDWINTAVQMFCRRMKIIQSFKTYWREEER